MSLRKKHLTIQVSQNIEMSFFTRKSVPFPKGKERISPFREIEKKIIIISADILLFKKGRLSMDLLVAVCHSYRYCNHTKI